MCSCSYLIAQQSHQSAEGNDLTKRALCCYCRSFIIQMISFIFLFLSFALSFSSGLPPLFLFLCLFTPLSLSFACSLISSSLSLSLSLSGLVDTKTHRKAVTHSSYSGLLKR